MLKEKTVLFLSTGVVSYDCNKNIYYPLTKIFKKVINYTYIEKDINLANKEIIGIIDSNKIDYVLYMTYRNEVKFATLDYINSLGIKTIAINPDDHWKFNEYSKDVAKHLSCSLTTDKNCIKKYEDMGCKSILFQWGSDPDYYVYDNTVTKIYDVSFVGQIYGKRGNNLKYIGKHIKIECFGRGTINGFIKFEDMINIYNQSKVNLHYVGSSEGWHLKQIKNSTFGIPMCGGFLLTEYFDGLEDYFKIGEEVESFITNEEAVDKIKYYLKHNNKRKRIALAGRERVLKDHTYELIFKRVFESV